MKLMKKKGKGKGKGCKALVAVLTLMTLGACVADPNFKAYVIADRLDYDVQSVHYTQLVNADPKISVEDKATFLARVQAKGKMLSDAEKLLGVK